jgi:hypothetical protein
MNSYIKSIFAFFGILLMVSCSKSNETETSPYCGIISFGVSSIVSYVPYNTSSGGTVLQKKTVDGSSILFNIDQQENTIRTANPLPNWIDLTKVVPTFSCYGSLFYINGETMRQVTSGTDSLDFTVPHTLRCYSSDGLYQKEYLVTFDKNPDVQDTILWESVATNLNLDDDDHKSLVVTATYKDITGADSLVRRIFVFSNNGSGQPQVTSTTERSQATTWTNPTVLTGADGTIDFNTVTLHKGELYALDDQNKLYKSTEAEKGLTWTKVANTDLTRLLASDGVYLYGYNGTKVLSTKDYMTWNEVGDKSLDMLPQTDIYNFYRTSYTNNKIIIVMMGGMTSNNTGNGVTWYKTTDTEEEDEDPDPWDYMGVSDENAYGCPYLQEASTVWLDDKLYMMGRDTDGKFAGIYRSEDNGISWHLQNTKWRLPAALDGNNGGASMVLLSNVLYVMQKGGKVWRGTIK